MCIKKYIISSVPRKKGMVSLVTGGASGLGRATVGRLVRNGAKAVILDIQGTKAEEVAKEFGADVLVSQGCVKCNDDIERTLEMIETKFGKLDILVNCAGIAEPYQIYDFVNDKECSIDNFKESILVNAFGTFNVTRYACNLFAKNEPGKDGQTGVVILTSSPLLNEGDVGQVGLAAVNAAFTCMTLPLCRDISRNGVRVVTIAPGPFDTPLNSNLQDKTKGLPQKSKRGASPLSHIGKPEEYAHLVTSIIENHMLNGAIIKLNGLRSWEPVLP